MNIKAYIFAFVLIVKLKKDQKTWFLGYDFAWS